MKFANSPKRKDNQRARPPANKETIKQIRHLNYLLLFKSLEPFCDIDKTNDKIADCGNTTINHQAREDKTEEGRNSGKESRSQSQKCCEARNNHVNIEPIKNYCE